ncbi:hypothetical protein M5K25_013719 [Dendrobium thyrsiflorum]|uniref:DUF4283 domain-containing protein n=1 Tax=Dendrobium thyrsiflorum TaxID=117978 RepID=A0ABD0V112_DENTH
MGDPDVDHGFVFDDQGRTNILRSPFFDVHFGADKMADDYVDRILYQLTLTIEQHNLPGRWYIVNRPSTSTDLATSPTTSTRGVLLSVALLIVACLLLRQTLPQQRELPGGPWYINGHIIGVDKWTPQFSTSLKGLTSPIWVRMPHLPLLCWDQVNVTRVASMLGTPLWIDGNMFQWSNREYARVCVRMALDNQFPMGVWVEGKVGHLIEDCILNVNGGSVEGVSRPEEVASLRDKVIPDDVSKGPSYGPWVHVTNRRRRKVFSGDRRDTQMNAGKSKGSNVGLGLVKKYQPVNKVSQASELEVFEAAKEVEDVSHNQELPLLAEDGKRSAEPEDGNGAAYLLSKELALVASGSKVPSTAVPMLSAEMNRFKILESCRE